jgi:glycine/D-amino acid oxidase-like deaminating enzyme
MLKKQLWTTCQETTHQQGIEHRAATIYRKLIKRAKQAALYGECELSVTVPLHHDEYVEMAVLKRLAKDGLHVNARGAISWKPSAEEEQVPLLTARELVQAGYNPGDGDLFKRILQSLQKAIARGEVRNDLLQAQIIWVNEHFKKV